MNKSNSIVFPCTWHASAVVVKSQHGSLQDSLDNLQQTPPQTLTTVSHETTDMKHDECNKYCFIQIESMQ